MPSPGKHYRAFISYSHRDTKWAKWLHRSLERYVVPVDAFPPEEKLEADGSKKKRRLTPVFRDRDELSVSGSLADAIREALEVSENLIVLCSPESSASHYVNAEIELFRSLHADNDKKIYALIIEGEPPGCFPPALTAGGAEPIAADAREEGDGKGDAKLKLIAGILGVGFDRLKRRQAKRQRNQWLAMVTLVSAVAVMTTVLAVRATRAERNANIQEKASRARVLSATEPMKALALALDTAEEEQNLKGKVSAPVLSSLLHTLEAGRETAYYKSGSGHQITDCESSPDGRLIAYTSARGVHVVDRASGLSRKIFKEGNIRKIAFDAKSELLVMGNEQGKIFVMRIDGHKVLWERQAHEGSVKGVGWLGSSGQLVSCGGGGLMRFWTADGAQAAPDVSFPVETVGAFAVSPDGKLAAAAASELAIGDGSWMVQLESGKKTKLKTGDDLIRVMVFDSESLRLAGAGLDRVIQFWGQQGQALGGTIRTGHAGAIDSLAFHPFEPLIVSGAEDGTIRGYTESGGLAFAPLHGHIRTIRSIDIDSTGSYAVSAGEDGTVRAWDLTGLQAAPPIQSGINNRALLFRPDGSQFAAGSMDGKIRIYAYPSGELLQTIDAHTAPCNILEGIPDGSGFASTASETNEVKVFSWEGETDGSVFKDPGGQIHVIAAHRQDPELFVLGSSGDLHTLALPSLAVIEKKPFSGGGGGVSFRSKMAVLPESDSLLLRANSFINIREIEEPGKVQASEGDLQGTLGQKYRMAVSPDFKSVLTGGTPMPGRSLHNLYRLPELERIGEFELPWGETHVAAISRTGREMLLISKEGSLQLMSTNGAALGPVLEAHAHDPRGFAMHPTEEVLATAGGDGWIRFWNFGEEAWMRTARVRLGRAKAQSGHSSSILSRTASRILSRKKIGSGRSVDGRIDFPDAGINLKIPDGWAQFDPRALTLLEKIVAAAGSVEARRVKFHGAFSRGEEVQLRIFGAPNFYVGTAKEFRGVENFARQLPEFQAKLQGLVRRQSSKFGFAREVVLAEPVWNADLRAFVLEGTGKSSNGSFVRMKTWALPTRSHTVVVASFGEANLAQEVESIMQSIKIDAAIAPGEDEYARAEETLEVAIASFEQRDSQWKEARRDSKRLNVLRKIWNEKKQAGKMDEALASCEEALELTRKWTRGSEAKLGEMVNLDWTKFSFQEIGILHDLANLHLSNKDPGGVEKSAGEALEILETYRLGLNEKDAPGYHQREADCYQDMCRAAELRKDYVTAAEWMKKCVDARRLKSEAEPEKSAEEQMIVADAMAFLAEMQRKGEDYKASISSAEDAIEVANSLAGSVRKIDWAKKVSNYYKIIASSNQSAGNGKEEISAANQALDFAEASREAFSNSPRSRFEVTESRIRLMNAIRRHDKARWQDVSKLMRDVVDELAAIRSTASKGQLKGIDVQRIESDRRRDFSVMLWRHADELRNKGESDELELSYFDQAVAEAEEAVKLSDRTVFEETLQDVYRRRAGFFSRKKQYDQLKADQEKRVAVLRRIVSKNKQAKQQKDLAGGIRDYATALEKVEDLTSADQSLDESLDILTRVIKANPDDFWAKDLMLAVEGTAIHIAGKNKNSDKVRSLRESRLVLADELMDRTGKETVPLIQVFYAYLSEARHRMYSKKGGPEDWIALYKKALQAIKRIESDGKFNSTLIKSRDECLSTIEKLKAETNR